LKLETSEKDSNVKKSTILAEAVLRTEYSLTELYRKWSQAKTAPVSTQQELEEIRRACNVAALSVGDESLGEVIHLLMRNRWHETIAWAKKNIPSHTDCDMFVYGVDPGSVATPGKIALGGYQGGFRMVLARMEFDNHGANFAQSGRPVVTEEEAKMNAKRIRAMWNMCRGFTTEQLETMWRSGEKFTSGDQQSTWQDGPWVVKK
jgi:hypothetical protein